jgi:hypothetical protein
MLTYYFPFPFLRHGVVLAYYCTHRPRLQLGDTADGAVHIVFLAFEDFQWERADRLPVDDDGAVHGRTKDRGQVQADRARGGDVQDGSSR